VLLSAAAPFLLFPGGWRTLALAVIPLIWIGNRLATGHFIRRTPVDAIILVLLVMALVSLYATYDIAISLPKIAGLLLGVGVFYVFVSAGRHATGWWICLLAFLTVGLGIAAISLLGTQWGAKLPLLDAVIARLPIQITGLPGAETGFNPNEVAGALLWVIPMFVTLTGLALIRARAWLASYGRRWGILTIAGLAIGTLTVTGVFLLAQSRGAYIALILAGLVLLPIALPSRKRWLALGGLGLVVILAILVARPGGANSLVQAIFGGSAIGDPGSILNSFEGRLEIWSRALYAIQDFPFTGMGMNTFRYVVHILYPLFLIPPGTDIAHAHNEFLQAALDLGLPGLIAFVALYLVAFSMLHQLWHSPSPLHATRNTQHAPLFPPHAPRPTPHAPRNTQHATRNTQHATRTALLLGLAVALLAHLIYGLTDAVALGAKPGLLFWMLLGLITALYEQTHLSPIR
jgi:putative inorganic carbon (HCO3(-)) transporter